MEKTQGSTSKKGSPIGEQSDSDRGRGIVRKPYGQIIMLWWLFHKICYARLKSVIFFYFQFLFFTICPFLIWGHGIWSVMRFKLVHPKV